jgi:hypothetical protein
MHPHTRLKVTPTRAPKRGTQKVASPSDLQTELLRIIAYVQGTQRPERARIAADLNNLADRVADTVMPRVKWTKVIAGDKARIRLAMHPENAVLIEELPGKPLKKRLRRAFIEMGWWTGQRDLSSRYFIVNNLQRDAKFNAGMTYDSAIKAMQKALDKAKDDIQREHPEYDDNWFKQRGWEHIIHEEDVSYLNVEPADYEPIKIEGKDFSGMANWDTFKFYAKRDEDEYMAQMEGMSAFYKSKSPGGSRKLFKLLKADPNVVKGMNIDQFTGWLAKNKIAYDYVPTVWR